ncbi:MAG: hypothetical protein HYX41_01765 [Bdellovibrio sp.]|nr:hypothetical protein [Bdellovibrio sp.]
MMKKTRLISFVAGSLFGVAAMAGDFTVYGESAKTAIDAFNNAGAQVQKNKKGKERLSLSQMSCAEERVYVGCADQLRKVCRFNDGERKLDSGVQDSLKLLQMLGKEGLNIEKRSLAFEFVKCANPRDPQVQCTFRLAR